MALLTSSVFFNLLSTIIIYFTREIYFLLFQVSKQNNTCD